MLKAGWWKQIWLKTSAEQQFLYGHHVMKAGLGRITENTDKYQVQVQLAPISCENCCKKVLLTLWKICVAKTLKNYIIFTLKFGIKKPSKIWVWDLIWSGIQNKPNRNPGSRVKKAPDPGSATLILTGSTRYIFRIVTSFATLIEKPQHFPATYAAILTHSRWMCTILKDI